MATHFPTLRQLPSPLLPNKKPALSVLRRDLSRRTALGQADVRCVCSRAIKPVVHWLPHIENPKLRSMFLSESHTEEESA